MLLLLERGWMRRREDGEVADTRPAAAVGERDGPRTLCWVVGGREGVDGCCEGRDDRRGCCAAPSLPLLSESEPIWIVMGIALAFAGLGEADVLTDADIEVEVEVE